MKTTIDYKLTWEDLKEVFSRFSSILVTQEDDHTLFRLFKEGNTSYIDDQCNYDAKIEIYSTGEITFVEF